MKLFDRNHQNPPPDPLDDLLAAAVLGELTPEERAQLELRLQTDAAARAAYQETLHMHDLLEKSYRNAQPDPAFEERMVSGVRRKLRNEREHRETAWESVVMLWRGMKWIFSGRRWVGYSVIGVVVLLLAGVAFGPITAGTEKAKESRDLQMARAKAVDQQLADIQTRLQPVASPASSASAPMDANGAPADTSAMPAPTASVPPGGMELTAGQTVVSGDYVEPPTTTTPQAGTIRGTRLENVTEYDGQPAVTRKSLNEVTDAPMAATATTIRSGLQQAANQGTAWDENLKTESTPAQNPATSPEPTRKLVRNASLDLEVKNFQATVDSLTALVNAGGGYVDSSNSQLGGNGKRQGTVVVKVLPEKLDAFLLKLRDLGSLKNQSVSTEDVTKAYYDTEARLDNSRRMEAQLQELLKHDTNRVSDLLQVERELGRVQGEIEQMQGELKLYDFQVQYATVTIAVQEKDLNQAAAYLLKENDQFSLFAPNVETAFSQARQAADDFKGQVLNANLAHNSGADVSATLAVSVPPEQVEGFLAKVKTLGRIDNFTRETERVANDGGDSDQPSDATKTEKDRVMVNVTIHSDDESARQQTQVSIVAADGIDAKAQQLKLDAAAAGAIVTASSFQRAADGTETASLTFRLPMGKTPAFMETLKKLGKVETLTVNRNDQPGEAQADENAPAEIDLTLHNEAAIVADDNGLWPTLRRTFGKGIAAFLGSMQTIGVVVAFVLPWLVALVIAAWIGRRVYVMRKR
jgi:anti-sigma factor RsiW